MAETINDLYLTYVDTVGKSLEGDRYFQYLFEMIQAGANTLQQNSQVLHKVVDERWISTIEESLDAINDIIEKPRRFVTTAEEVVPVALAKKITADSVRHLSMNTQFIASNDEGDIQPTRILNVTTEESYDLYENRFIYHLIQRLVTFIDKRTDVIFWSTGDETRNILKLNSKVDDAYEEIEYKIEMSVKNRQSFAENDSDNMQVFMRIDRIRRLVLGLRNSAFCRLMAGCGKVRSPIQRTNLMMKDPSYRTCYKLWQFLESYDEVGYSIVEQDSALEFDEEYLIQIYTNFITNYAVFKSILDTDPRKLDEQTLAKRRRARKPKFIKKVEEELVDDPNIPDVEIRKVFVEEVTQAQLDAEKKLQDEIKLREAAEQEVQDTFQRLSQVMEQSMEAQSQAQSAEKAREEAEAKAAEAEATAAQEKARSEAAQKQSAEDAQLRQQAQTLAQEAEEAKRTAEALAAQARAALEAAEAKTAEAEALAAQEKAQREAAQEKSAEDEQSRKQALALVVSAEEEKRAAEAAMQEEHAARLAAEQRAEAAAVALKEAEEKSAEDAQIRRQAEAFAAQAKVEKAEAEIRAKEERAAQETLSAQLEKASLAHSEAQEKLLSEISARKQAEATAAKAQEMLTAAEKAAREEKKTHGETKNALAQTERAVEEAQSRIEAEARARQEAESKAEAERMAREAVEEKIMSAVLAKEAAEKLARQEQDRAAAEMRLRARAEAKAEANRLPKLIIAALAERREQKNAPKDEEHRDEP